LDRLSVVALAVIAALEGVAARRATSPRAPSLDSVLRFAVQLAERRPSALDHGAGGNRVSGCAFPQRRITVEARIDLAQAEDLHGCLAPDLAPVVTPTG
jgi:hypothetical protein